MSVKGELNDEFLLQDFTDNDWISRNLERYSIVAAGYARIENAIAVLSDLKERVSHIYCGGLAQTLGIGKKESIIVSIPFGKKRYSNVFSLKTWIKGIATN